MESAKTHLLGIEGFPRELRNGVLVDFLALGLHLLLNALDPAQNLLVSEAVQRPSQGVESARVRQVRV